MIIKSFFTFLIIAYSSALFATTPTTNETSTAAYLATIKNDPNQLLLFLQNMPKGADLHYHLGGAPMPEYLVTYSHGKHFCINRQDYSAIPNKTNCPQADLLENVQQDSALYNNIINNWSMRDFVHLNESAHDHFFATFPKTDALIAASLGEVIAEVLDRAGSQHESYIELMVTADSNASGMLGKQIPWTGLDHFAERRQQLLANGINKVVLDMQKTMDSATNQYRSILACGTPQAKPGCGVKVAFLYQALRSQPPEQVFAQLLAGFEIASKDPRFVGINFVQAEDDYIPMRDYHLHMQMFDFFHRLYPNVHISLHAGELNSTIVPPEGLRFHIREAIDLGHAERIGHGVDVAYESNARQLLKDMADKHIPTEICLTSNETLLNLRDPFHPFSLYLNSNIPTVISTDDEGVLRTTLTTEYQKAILRYQLDYLTLKNLVRNSLYFSFQPGKHIWTNSAYQSIVNECASDPLGSPTPTAACAQFLKSNPKASLEWDLENRFNQFESEMTKH